MFWGGGGESHIKMTGCPSYLLRVKKVVLLSLRVLILSTAGAFAVLFRVLSRKHMKGDYFLF